MHTTRLEQRGGEEHGRRAENCPLDFGLNAFVPKSATLNSVMFSASKPLFRQFSKFQRDVPLQTDPGQSFCRYWAAILIDQNRCPTVFPDEKSDQCELDLRVPLLLVCAFLAGRT